MTDPTATATEALAPLAEALAADGYRLHVDAAGDGLALRVEAGPEACAECLVPKQLFVTMVGDRLAGTPLAGRAVELAYPADGA